MIEVEEGAGSANEHLPHAVPIREAIADNWHRRGRGAQSADAFGLWGKDKVDGLEYQSKMCAEW